jgi:peptidoglycan/xylan/chitin deacetylase (PgdA/CDA1 family)
LPEARRPASCSLHREADVAKAAPSHHNTRVRERFRAAIQFSRSPGRGVPGRGVPAASMGAASSLVLFASIVAALMLSGAGIGPAAARAPSPGPAQMALSKPSAAAAGVTIPPRPAAPPAAAIVPVSSVEPVVAPVPTAPLSQAADPSSTVRLHVPIFEYHRVKEWEGETGSAHDLIVPPTLFAEQMDAMAAAGWHTITMGELGDDLSRGIQPGPKSFVVTLDDGYEDGYTNAFPVLRQHGFVATFFVIGGRIGNPNQLTVAEMQDLVAAGDEIGNHTLDHRDLKPMTPEMVVSEIYTTQALIATAVGVWPASFCYPKGLTNAAVTAIVAATPGLVTAVIQTGSMPETWANRLSLPRIRVGPGAYPHYLVDMADRFSQ